MKFQIDKNQTLNLDDIARILQIFQTTELPRLKKLKDYYQGHQAILQKTYSDPSKPLNKIVCNFCQKIVREYQGYLTGKPIKYQNDNFEEIIDILNYNDIVNEDNEFLRQALIYGKSFEVNYIDEDGKQRFTTLDTRGTVPVYADDLTEDLLYVIRFWRQEINPKVVAEPSYYVEVYSNESIKKYESTPGFTSFRLLEEIPHFYKQVPVTVFELNQDDESIFAQIIGLQDAYNELLSSQLDDWDAFVDSYMLIKNQHADEEDLAAMKEHRILLIDGEDADVKFITKDSSNAQVSNMLQNYKEQIYQLSNCIDTSQDTFNAQSGIAIRYKLQSLENAVVNIESRMKKALQRRIELICSILNLTGSGSEAAWRDVTIVMTRNLPQTLEPSSISELMQLKGLVSDKTLLEQLPFIKNVDEEMKLVAEQEEAEKITYSEDFESYEDNNMD